MTNNPEGSDSNILFSYVALMPRSHIHGLDAGLATDVHSW